MANKKKVGVELNNNLKEEYSEILISKSKNTIFDDIKYLIPQSYNECKYCEKFILDNKNSDNSWIVLTTNKNDEKIRN